MSSKATWLLVLLSAAWLAGPSASGQLLARGGRPRSDRPTIGHRRTRQVDLGSEYAGEYGVKLKPSSRGTSRPSRSQSTGSTSLISSRDGVTHVSIDLLDDVTASFGDQLDDVTNSPVGLQDDVAYVSPEQRDYVTYSTILGLSDAKDAPDDSVVEVLGPSAMSHHDAPAPVVDTLSPPIELHDTLSQTTTPNPPISFVRSPTNVADIPPKGIGSSTLFFETVESHLATILTTNNSNSTHVKHPELDPKYPDINLRVVFREYAQREGLNIDGDRNTTVDTKKTYMPILNGNQSSELDDLAITPVLSENVAKVPPKPKGLPIEQNKFNTVAPSLVLKANLGTIRDSPLDGGTEEVGIEAAKIDDDRQKSLKITSALPKTVLPALQQQRDYLDDNSSFRNIGQQSISTTQNQEDSHKRPAPPAINLHDQPSPSYVFNRFRYSAPVLVDGQPEAFVYVDETFPQRHIVLPGEHFHGAADDTESEDDDNFRAPVRGQQLSYATSAPTADGQVVHVYEDERSPPTQIIIPCDGCRSELGFLSVVGDPPADDDIDKTLEADETAQLESENDGTDGQAIETAVPGDLLQETDVDGYSVESGWDGETRDTSFEIKNQPRLGRSSNETQSGKSVNISGSYETRGPIGHLNLPGHHRFVTFTGRIPPFLRDSTYYLPLPGSSGFLPTSFSYDPRGISPGVSSLSGNIHRPIHLSTPSEIRRTGSSENAEKHLKSAVAKQSNTTRYSLPIRNGREDNTRLPHQLKPVVPLVRRSTIPPTRQPKLTAPERRRRATFQKVTLRLERRPVTPTPRPPPTLGPLTRGQRYTVLNDVHANIRQLRRMLTSTPAPNVTTTTETDQELRDQTLKMIHDLREDKIASFMLDSAEYKAALTAQLKKQLQFSSSVHNGKLLKDEIKEALNHTPELTSDSDEMEDSHLDHQKESVREPIVDVDQSVEKDTPASMEMEKQAEQDSSNKTGSATEKPTSPIDEPNMRPNKTSSLTEVGTPLVSTDHHGDKFRKRQREIKKAERNAELAIKLKEKLLREMEAQKPLSTSDGSDASPSVIEEASTSTGSPASLVAEQDLSSLGSVAPISNADNFDREDLSNFGKALSMSHSVTESVNESSLSMATTQTPAEQNNGNNLNSLHDPNYMAIGAPEDYVRHAMLHNAISDGTFLHVAEVDHTTQGLTGDDEDKSHELDDVPSRYPFDSALTLTGIMPGRINFEEEDGRSLAEDFDSLQTDTSVLTSLDDSLDETDHGVKTFVSGLSGIPNVIPTYVDSVDSDKPLSEGIPGRKAVTGYLQNIDDQQKPKPDMAGQHIKPHKIQPPGFNKPAAKQRGPKAPLEVADTHDIRRPSQHTRHPSTFGPEHHRFRGEDVRNIRPVIVRRPRPGVRPVPADRPINFGVSSEPAGDDSFSNDPVGSELSEQLTEAQDSNSVFSDTDFASRPRPVGSIPVSRPRPRPGSRPPHPQRPPGAFRPHMHGPRTRPPPPRPPQGFFRRMYHRMMHNIQHMMGPRRYPRRRPAMGYGHDQHHAYRSPRMGALLGVYRGEKSKPKEEQS